MKILAVIFSVLAISAHAEVNAFYQLEVCDAGQGPQTLTFWMGQNTITANDQQGQKFLEANNVNQGLQTSWKFIALGRQDRYEIEASFKQSVLSRNERRFGHLVLSPLGLPYYEKQTTISFEQQGQMRLEESVRSTFMGPVEKTDCTYFGQQ